MAVVVVVLLLVVVIVHHHYFVISHSRLHTHGGLRGPCLLHAHDGPRILLHFYSSVYPICQSLRRRSIEPFPLVENVPYIRGPNFEVSLISGEFYL